MDNNAKTNVGALIREQLKDNGQSASWLSEKVFQTRSNFNRKLNHNHLDVHLLMRISRVLNVDFFACLSEEFQK